MPYSILQELAFLPFFIFGQLNDSNQEGEGEMDRKTASFFCVSLHMHQNRKPRDRIQPVTILRYAVQTSCCISEHPRLHEITWACPGCAVHVNVHSFPTFFWPYIIVTDCSLESQAFS